MLKIRPGTWVSGVSIAGEQIWQATEGAGREIDDKPAVLL
jgi:hypothetical protein